MDTIGKRILQVRKNLKLTQSEFAAQFGLSHSHISNIENERLMPTETLLLFIVEKYNINYEWLKSGIGYMYGESYNIFAGDEDLRIKNKDTLQMYNRHVNNYTGDDLFNIIEGFARFVSIISVKDLNESNRKILLSSFYDILDNLEYLVVHAHGLRSTQKVIHDNTILNLKLEEEMRSKKILQDIKELCNAYLQQYNSTIRF